MQGHMDGDPRPDTGGLHPVSATCASGRPEFSTDRGTTALFVGAPYLRRVAGSCSLSHFYWEYTVVSLAITLSLILLD